MQSHVTCFGLAGDIVDAEIDILFSDLEDLGVNTQKLRSARISMNKEQLRDSLRKLLKEYRRTEKGS